MIKKPRKTLTVIAKSKIKKKVVVKRKNLIKTSCKHNTLNPSLKKVED